MNSAFIFSDNKTSAANSNAACSKGIAFRNNRNRSSRCHRALPSQPEFAMTEHTPSCLTSHISRLTSNYISPRGLRNVAKPPSAMTGNTHAMTEHTHPRLTSHISRLMSIITLLCTLYALPVCSQAWLTNTGLKVYIAPGTSVNIQGGGMYHDSSSAIHNYGYIRTDTARSAGALELKGAHSRLEINSALQLDDGTLRLNGNTLLLHNGDTAALQAGNGKIIEDTLWGKIIWSIGANTGRYVIPLAGGDTLDDLTVEFEVLKAGDGIHGALTFATFRTGNDNLPYPGVFDEDASRFLDSNQLLIADRYWQLSADGYDTLPAMRLTLRYREAEAGGDNMLVPDSLVLSWWDGNCWQQATGTVDAGNRAFTTDSFSVFQTFVLHDKAAPPDCNDGSACDRAFYLPERVSRVFEIPDTALWFRFTADADSHNLFRLCNTLSDTLSLNIETVELYAACADTVFLDTIQVGSDMPVKYLSFAGLTPGSDYLMRIVKKTPGDTSVFRIDCPDLRLFANVAVECSDTAAADEVCLWYSDYSSVYPCGATPNTFIWKVFDADTQQLAYADTTTTLANKLDFTLAYGSYSFIIEERNASGVLLYEWKMPDYMPPVFKHAEKHAIEYESSLYGTDFTNITINTDKDVGTIIGIEGTTPTGASTYTIPIPLPPGTNGMVPNIALVYNSQAGNGHLGMGWSISGLPVISRVGKSMFPDNEVTPVSLTTNDLFAIDGNKLIKAFGGQYYGGDGTMYFTEIEDFSIISSYEYLGGNIANGPLWFKVETKEGLIMEFGNHPNARFLNKDNDKVIFWRLNKIIDNYGNFIIFSYDNGSRDSRITEIEYTVNPQKGLTAYNNIKFEYEGGRIDENKIYTAGSEIAVNHLLKNIIITADNNLPFKTYEIKYANDNIYTYLKEIIEYGASGSDLNSTKFRYGDQPQSCFGPSGSFSVQEDNADIFPGDFNGDGLTDLLVATYEVVGNKRYHKKFKIYMREPNGQFTLKYTSPTLDDGTVITRRSDIPNYGFIASDYNGDGIDDFLILKTSYDGSYNRLDNVTIYRGNISLTNFSTINAPVPLGNYINLSGNYFFPGDFDGDGRMDFITFLAESRVINGIPVLITKAFLNFPGKGEFNVPLNIDLPLGIYSLESIVSLRFDRVFVVDFNGDGKHELMVIRDESDGGKCDIFSIDNLNSSAYIARSVADNGAGLGYPTFWHDIFHGDFNGDGKTDILTRVKSSDTWSVAYSTGKSFDERIYPPSAPLFDPMPRFDSNDLLDKLTIADFNGDGKSDIMHGYNALFNEKVIMYYSRGSSFERNQVCGSMLWGYNESFIADYNLVGDFNGDGRADAINPTSPSSYDFIYFKRDGKERILFQLRNGFNRTVTFDYELLTNNSFYTKGATLAYPWNNVQTGMHAVSYIATTDGIGGVNKTEFKYEQAKVHRSGRGFLGFTKITAENMNISGTGTAVFQKTVDEYIFNMESALPALKKTTNMLPNGALIGFIEYDNQFPCGRMPGCYNYYPRVRESEQRDYSGAQVKTLFNYDNFGNILKSTGNYGIEIIETESPAYFAIGSPVPSKPLQVNTKISRSGQHFINATKFEYYNEGAVKKMFEFANKPCEVLTEYEYDDFGNLTKETVSASGLDARTTSYFYDAKKRYPTTIRNSLNKDMSYTYNPRWGKPVSVTGIDGNTTEYVYDEWGRTSEVTVKKNTSDEYSISTSFDWDEFFSSSYPTTFYALTEHPGKPDVKIWYDVFGRETKRKTEGFNGQWLDRFTRYDYRGNVITEIHDHYSSENSSHFQTDYSYDDLTGYNQLKTVSTIIGSTNYSYAYQNGRTTATVTNPASQQHTTITDVSGKVIRSTDSGGILTYDYYADGNQKSVKLGNVTLAYHEFDHCGRQTLLSDKNSGITQYRYNAFGELEWQQDANGNEYDMEYDLLGRITLRDGPEGETKYDYVETGNGINQIKKITGFNGYNQEFTYDQFGRTTQVKEAFPIGNFLTDYTYDRYDNTETVTFPSNFGIKYFFDTNGFLTDIKNKDDLNTVFFSNPQYNGLGQCKAYTLGNGLNSTIGYFRGIPTGFYTEDVQDLQLTYHFPSGNITERKDEIKDWKEGFTYDNLNRLTSSLVSNINETTLSFVRNYTYAPNGNLLTKPDAGKLVYSPHKINAVTRVNDDDDLFPNAFIPNDIPSLTQDITYTPFHQPEKITEGDYELTYTYGFDYQRRYMELKENNDVIATRHYLGNYEYRTGDGVTAHHVHYITSPAGLAAIVTKTASGPFVYNYTYTDHLGSILTVTDDEGEVIAEQNFDAWGRRRNPNNWTYNNIPDVPAWMYRGFTGHEHVPQFALINMNGRLYDPVLGRMLSPDNYVQSPFSTQSYNRYSYVVNNPLKYVDPSGEVWFVPIIIGAVYGAAYGAIRTDGTDEKWYNGLWKGALVGGASGALSIIGGASLSFAGNLFLGAAQGAATGMLDAALWGNNIGQGALWGAIGGAAMTTLTSENFKNLHRGEKFLSNEKVFNNMMARGVARQDILDYFGFEGTYAPNKTSTNYQAEGYWGVTNPNTGEISYGEFAFDNYGTLHATYKKESYSSYKIKHGKPIKQVPNEMRGLNMEYFVEETYGYLYAFKNQGLYPNHNFPFQGVEFYQTALYRWEFQLGISINYATYPKSKFFYSIPRRW